jgi:hypothetical protein
MNRRRTDRRPIEKVTTMAPPRFLPSDTVLAQWKTAGWTHRQMADEVLRTTGVEVSIGTVSAALSRAGLTRQIRYDAFIPWSPIRTDHVNAYALLMLRYAARVDAGIELTEKQTAMLGAWVERLHEEKAVVTYSYDTDEGWFYVPRRPRIDMGLIRVPGRD